MRFVAHASSSRGNLMVVDSGPTRIMLEAGLPMARIRKRIHGGPAATEGCLLTHCHMDHAKSAAALLRLGVPVYCSQGTAEALGLVGAHIIRARVPVQIGCVAVTPLEAQHDAAEPLAFALDDGHDRLLFATDTAALPFVVPGLTMIALEANYAHDLLPADMPAPRRQRLADSHLSLAGALEILAATDLSRVREIHLLHLSRAHSDAERFRLEVEGAFGIPCAVAPE